MRTLLTFLGILIIVFTFEAISFGQSIDTSWTKIYWNDYYDSANCVQETSDGGFIITGSSILSGEYQSNIALIKTDADGNVDWYQRIGDENDEAGYHVLEAVDGGYLICAHSSGFGADPGAIKIWIVKTDDNGDTTWTYPIETYRTDGFPTYAVQTYDSGYAITGKVNISYDWKSFILRLDKDGGLEWFTTYNHDGAQDGRFIAELPDSDLIVAGQSDGGYTTNDDYWAFRTDQNGGMIWDSTYVITEYVEEAHSACLVSDGLVIVGEARGAGHVHKIDFDGNTVWSKPVSIYQANEEYNSICPTSDGGLMVGGWVSVQYYGRNYCFQKLDAAGDTTWTFTVGGGDTDRGYSVIQTSDDSYIMAGLSNSWVNGGCIWLTKISDIISDVTAINSDVIPNSYYLSQNYPNPFNPSTVIQFTLPHFSRVKIEIYNTLGQTVRNLVDEDKPAGQYQITWNGVDNYGKPVSSGIYFYKIIADGFRFSKKMILLK